MSDISVWFLNLFPWLSGFIPLLAFLAPIVGSGELGVIAAAFIFAKSSYYFWIIVIFSFIGMMTADSFWFLVSRSKLAIKLKNMKSITKQYKNLEESIEKLSHGKDILIIFLAKIMVGTRILLFIYMGGRKITFSKFSEV